MELKNALDITTKEQFYGWLAANHATAAECWVSCKRGRKWLTDGELWYIDAVEMALCFGWIDSTVKSVGGRTWQRFKTRHGTETCPSYILQSLSLTSFTNSTATPANSSTSSLVTSNAQL